MFFFVIIHSLSLSLSLVSHHGTVDRHVSQGVIFPAWGLTVFTYYSPSPLLVSDRPGNLLASGTAGTSYLSLPRFEILISDGNKANTSFSSAVALPPNQFFEVWSWSTALPTCVNTTWARGGNMLNTGGSRTSNSLPYADNGAGVRGKGMKVKGNTSQG